jgi:hypothetical protein
MDYNQPDQQGLNYSSSRGKNNLNFDDETVTKQKKHASEEFLSNSDMQQDDPENLHASTSTKLRMEQFYDAMNKRYQMHQMARKSNFYSLSIGWNVLQYEDEIKTHDLIVREEIRKNSHLHY